jgi:hypothetical protein
MRCPDCNKFVAFDESDPDVENIEVDDAGSVSITVKIVNTCEQCSQELKEATFELEADHSAEADGHQGEGHELSIEEDSSDRTSRSGYNGKKGFVPSAGRYAKTFYGAEVSYTIRCSCGELEISGTVGDDVQASGMDELV